MGARDIVHSCRALAQLVKGPEIDTLVPPKKEKGRGKKERKHPRRKRLSLEPTNGRQVGFGQLREVMEGRVKT